jgi:hypothetical protein
MSVISVVSDTPFLLVVACPPHPRFALLLASHWHGPAASPSTRVLKTLLPATWRLEPILFVDNSANQATVSAQVARAPGLNTRGFPGQK